MRGNRERLPGDAQLPPDLMNMYSKKMAGKKAGKFCFNSFTQDCSLARLLPTELNQTSSERELDNVNVLGI